MASPVFDALTSGNNNADHTSPFTFSHTITGTNPVLFVTVSIDISSGAQTVSSVTWNGSNCVLVSAQSETSQCRVEVWKFVAPGTGTANVVVTLTGTAHAQAAATSYTNADQSNPIGVIATPTHGNGGTSVTASITETTGTANSLLYCSISTEGDTLSSPSDTQRANIQNGIQTGVQEKTTTTPGSNTLSWTVTNAGGIQGWCMVMFEVLPPSSNTTNFFMFMDEMNVG